MLKEVLKQLHKERDEEDVARALIEEMQQHLDEAHARACETERKLPCTRGVHTTVGKRIGATALLHGYNVAEDAKQ